MLDVSGGEGGGAERDVEQLMAIVKKILHGLLGGRFKKVVKAIFQKLCLKMLIIRHLGGRLEASSRKSRGTGSGNSERGKRSSSVSKRRGGRRGKTCK